MNTLAFDTSTDNLGIALETEKGFYTFSLRQSLKHSEKLLPLTEFLIGSAGIKTSQIDLVVCAKGPGSFTGLRIGMATAKGISTGLSVPLVSVPTLDFLAAGLDFFDGAVVPVIDAKKNRYYTAVYAGGKRKSPYLDLNSGEIVDLLRDFNNIIFTGSDGGKIFSETAANPDLKRKSVFCDPLAQNSKIAACLEMGKRLFEKGETDSDSSGPVYIRKSDAEEKSADMEQNR